MKVIIFDFDGTIANSLAAVVRIANALAIEYGYPRINAADLKRLQNLTSREIVRQSGVPLFQLPFLLLRLRKELNREIHQLQLFPGMAEALLALKQHQHQLGIATSNSQENVQAFLEAQGLADLFDFIGTGLTLFGKDRVINQILKRHQIDPATVLYVGDETRDVESARRIRLRVIAVGWGFASSDVLAKQQPDRLIQQPSELVAAVDSLVG